MGETTSWGWARAGGGSGWLLCPLVHRGDVTAPDASDVRGMIASSPAHGGRLFAVRCFDSFGDSRYSDRVYADDMAAAHGELAELMGVALPPLPDGTVGAKSMALPASTLPEGLVLAVGAVAELAALPLTLRQLRALTAALLVRFPGLVGGGDTRASWREWTADEEANLRALYVDGTRLADICKALGRSVGAVRGAVSRLKLARKGES